jgi:iron complex transport system substrate-binding protein
MRFLALPLFAVALTGQALAADVSYESCGLTVNVDTPPSRALTLNQQATEVMLALGLEDKMVGTAYLEDAIPAQWAEAYNKVPVISDKYPAKEVVLVNEPDFLFAGFVSAFNEKNVGTQEEWNSRGVATYLVNASCDEYNPKDVPVTTAPILKDIEVIGNIFGVNDRADALIEETKARLEAVKTLNPGNGRTAFFFDSDTDPAYAGACCGGPALLMRTVGLKSVTDDVVGRWAKVSWEMVVQANPEIIILNDAGWSTAEEKITYMKNDPVISQLDAVKNERFLIIPFSETVLGMRFADGVETLATQLEALGQ